MYNVGMRVCVTRGGMRRRGETATEISEITNMAGDNSRDSLNYKV